MARYAINWTPDEAMNACAQWYVRPAGDIVGNVMIDDDDSWKAWCPPGYHLNTFKTRAEARAEVERVFGIMEAQAEIYKKIP
jgi:hypothetical protein